MSTQHYVLPLITVAHISVGLT